MADITKIQPMGDTEQYTLGARYLTHTPNNTTTFLRGDNTWSRSLDAMLICNAWPGLELVNPNKNNGETGLRVRSTDADGNNNIKAYFGWLSSQGSYQYNAACGKYLGIKDDGTPHFHGNTLLHAGNYNNYAPTKTGGGASGTWGINITGKARYVEGDNDAANPGGALLRSGAGRGDASPAGDTWIFYDNLGGTSTPWGIRHNQGANTIGFIGGGTQSSTIHLSNGTYSTIGPITTSSTITASGSITSSGQPAFNASVSTGNWSYLRLHNGSNLWDIASKSNENSGALDFRPAGASNTGPRIYTNGMLAINNIGEGYNYDTAAMQVREYRYAGANSDTWGHAPRLAWHWSGRVAAQIGLASNGYLYEAPLTATNFYQIVIADGRSYNITANPASHTHDISQISWAGSSNLACNGANTEWSIDMQSNATGSYWHVWSGVHGASCLQCWNSDRHVWAYNLQGAVWNDYAEYRHTDSEIEPGRCIREIGNDTLILTTERLMRGCEIVSDTYGFSVGKSQKNNTPTAASGRVLAYPYESLEEFENHIGWPVCSGPNGTISIMTEEEEEKYPSRIIGTISSVPDYEEWQCGDEKKPEYKKVNGRVWIRIR